MPSMRAALKRDPIQLWGVTVRAILLILAAMLSAGAYAAPIAPGQINVRDGDTVIVGAIRYRLVGYNTPEVGFSAKCPQERALGAQATQRLRRLVAGGGLDFERVSCQCRPGTEGTPACNYGRLCARLTAAGRDVGETLVAAGLAKPFRYGKDRFPHDWCSR
ncbi:thermonuclease family protein [Aquabacter sp. CN5-332]|uniref:thermonuclease family protein n=1 Tax=Aquabacter sp. CN5-332 TaxID=3156608 RepID=UPI0032B45422